MSSEDGGPEAGDADRAADGGATPETFEDVDWESIDATAPARSRKATLWTSALVGWSFGFLANLAAIYVLDAGPIAWPVIGPVSLVDWLWVFTLAIMGYYVVLPLWERPRLTRYYWRSFRRNAAAVVSAVFLLVVFLVGVVGSRVTPAPEPQPGLENQPPVWGEAPSYVVGTQCPGGFAGEGSDRVCEGSWAHPFGTTPSGEDLFLGVIHGMEVTMQVGLIATLLSVVIATGVALTAAYYGGLVDEVLFRYVDLQMTFPAFFLYLLLVYTVGGSLFMLVVILGVLGWGGGARLIRSEALQRREEPFMRAASAAGASSRYVIRRHLLPNVSNTVITYATLAIPGVILTEAALSFLGLGDPTVPSWGRLIADGREQLSNAWWISTIPGVFLFTTVLAFNFLGDALRDALDPRHGGGGE